MKATAENTTITKLERTLYHQQPFQVGANDPNAGQVKAWGLGVLRRHAFYCYCQERFLKKSTPTKVRVFLMLAMFRIDSQSSDHAKLVNHLVDKAKALNIQAAMVNAVLRRYLIEKTKLEQKTRGMVSVQYNVREDLLDKIKEQHQNWREIIRSMQQESRICLRVNVDKIAQPDFIAALKKHESSYAVDDQSGAVVLQQSVNITSIPGYNEGWFSVISAANQKLIAILPAVKKGERIRALDACAAPGGKSMLLREKYGKEANIVATDLDEERLTRLEENNQRLGLNLDCQQRDWQKDQGVDGEFDLVWADVPCSATGVIAKHPEIAICSRDDLQNATIQRELLTRLWSEVKVGGVLIYSTCSVLEEENGEVVQWFLSEQIDAQVEPGTTDALIESQHGRYFTSEHSRDFVYVCAIKKSVNPK